MSSATGGFELETRMSVRITFVMQHVIRRWKGIELSYPFLQKIFDKNHSFSLKLHLKFQKLYRHAMVSRRSSRECQI
jgi:hypothetical protein